MSIRIQLEKPDTWRYTNLDFVTGRVILILSVDSTISAINVKLEGESRTRLAGPKSPYNERSDKKRTELELHKMLYKVVTVFPTAEVQRQPTSGSSYTLPPGQYEYPFRFKVPFNNACSSSSSLLRDLKMGNLGVQFAPDTNQHVKKALPPSLTGFPGEAEIKYYVKVTVVRPKFYQENLRSLVDIKFVPIEPPRPEDRHEETFARRKQQFAWVPIQAPKKGLLRKSSHSEPVANQEPPAFQVDARLPNPAIITCNDVLPLRILVQKLNSSSAAVHLSMLQIELFAYTHVRAHDLTRTETTSWILTSQSNMNLPLGRPTDPVNKEWKVPSRYWDSIPLPNTVIPSFDTCNLSRTYDLEVRIGLAHSVSGTTRPELIVVPLRLPVKVYSGIVPPPALLKAIATSHQQEHLTAPVQHTEPSSPSQYIPPSPATPSYASPTAQVGTYGAPQRPYAEDDAPPSYEDAMAEEIAPIDGPRRNFDFPPDQPRRENAFNADSKRSGITRTPSERLFPQNNVDRHSRGSSWGASSFTDDLGQTSPVDGVTSMTETGPQMSKSEERSGQRKNEV